MISVGMSVSMGISRDTSMEVLENKQNTIRTYIMRSQRKTNKVNMYIYIYI